jgi:L-alanine-DL-glutamate epimerase-like enolase superfamily enzyme
MTEARIASVQVATIRAPLPEVIRFGPWVMEHREFVLCRVEATTGAVGHAFVYTRDGPIAAFVDRNIAPLYVGESLGDPAEIHWRVAWSNNAILASGLGLRALSLVDLAVWDLHARLQKTSVTRLLGGEPRAMPATAIIGYPPTLSADQVRAQVDGLLDAGWRRFTQPIAATPEATRQRLEAARATMGTDCWLGMDCNWVFKTAQEAIEFSERIRQFELDWIEDVVPAGDPAIGMG